MLRWFNKHSQREAVARCEKICRSFGLNLDKSAVEEALSRLPGRASEVVWARSPAQARRIVEGRHFSRPEVSPWTLCPSTQVDLPNSISELTRAWGRRLSSCWFPEMAQLPEALAGSHDVLGLGHWCGPRFTYQFLTGRGRKVDRLAGEVAAAGAWTVWLGRHYHLALAPPVEVHLDPHGLLHRSDGPAIVWPDGESSWSFRGRRLAAHQVMNPTGVDTAEVVTATDHASREALIELVGYPRMLEEFDWKLVDIDLDPQGQIRHLLKLDLPLQPLLLVKVTCPSTGEESLLRVPPHLTRCREAVAWTFGFDDPGDFDPVLET